MKGKSSRRPDAAALIGLALAVLLIYGKVLFTNLTPASGDFLVYYAPLWDYVNSSLRAGRLPLWNPMLFGGAPLLANPQASLFYPLRWLFLPFAAERGIVVSAALHAWLAGAFTYGLARRAGRVGPLAGLAAGLIFALNGWASGLLGHPNRWSTVPWLPAALLLWEMRPLSADGKWIWNRALRRWLVANAVVWALALLAGHSQTFYNQALIFATWAVAPALWRWAVTRRDLSGLLKLTGLVIAIFLLAAALSAVQILPTFELSRLSYRSGGLAYRDHAALSLPPWRLGFTLLPHYARDLGQALSTAAYGEWVGYVGLAGLALAAIGLGFGAARRLRIQAALLTIGGIVLAFGAYNPTYYLLYRFVPGWSFFRVPARWWEATALGLALLAALGVARLQEGWRPRWTLPQGRLRWLGGIGLLALIAFAALTRPTLITLALWLLTLLFILAALAGRGRWQPWAPSVLAILLVLELFGASDSLPLQHPTAPQALRSWRTAPARIAAEAPPDCRILSLSTTTYDPGDLADLRRIYGPALDARAFDDLVVATKDKEVVAPNLGLIFGLPSLDGFDGGLLPTRLFVQAMSLFLPADQVVADGRLREQLHEIPDPRLLSLFHVCYVIADKTFDAWQDDVYYDLAFGETLDLAHPNLTLTAMPDFPLTAVGLVTHLVGGTELAQGEPVAELTVTFTDGQTATLPLRVGLETFTGADAAGLAHRRDLPAVRWRYDAPGQDAIARLPLPKTGVATSLHFHLVRPDAALFVRGLAVLDERSRAHATPPVSRHPWQRIHSGDVKIYRNDGVLPRAFLVPQAEISPDDATRARLQDPTFDPAHTVLLASGESLVGSPPAGAAHAGAAHIVASDPEHLRIRVQTNAPAYLVISDAWHPGWQAAVDGLPTPLHRADLILRALAVPAGEHDVVLTFRPASLWWGAAISLLAMMTLGVLWWWGSWLPVSQAV